MNGELEELEDQIDNVDEHSAFTREGSDNANQSHVPSALSNRSLNKKSSNNIKNVTGRKPLNSPNANLKGLPQKDEGLKSKLGKKKRESGFMNRFKNSNSHLDDGSTNNNSVNNQSDEQSNEQSNDTSEELAQVAKKAKMVVLIIKIAAVFAIIGVIVAIIMAVVAVIASFFGISDSFSNLGSVTGLDPNEVYYEEAVEYYNNLNAAVERYVESCNIYLDRNYIHATLSYRFVSSEQENIDIENQYRLMANNVSAVADLMINNCSVDYEIGGNFYNNLKNSSFLHNYYNKHLQNIDNETLTNDIFEYAKLGIELQVLGGGFLNNNLKVTMGTCEQPYNKKLLNEGTSYTSTVGFVDYLMGTIYAEVDGHITNDKKEFLKAFTIAATSVALSRSNYKSGDDEIWVHNGNCWQVSCDIYQGCQYTKDLPGGYGTAFTGPSSDGKYWKKPLSNEKKVILQEVFNEVLGTVMLDTGMNYFGASYRDKISTCPQEQFGCMGQDDAALDALNGMNYKEILEKYYNNYLLSNIKEDNYTGDVTYPNGAFTKNVVFYDQTDYLQRFCGGRGTIKTSGCGVTSMAMILSTFIDKSYTPPTVMEEAYSAGYCGVGISGTSTSFFKYSAQKHGLIYDSVGKSGDKQKVLDALKSGKSLVVAHMGPGLFTSGGHYIILNKVNDNGQVYVLDPNYSRRTGWHNFNDIVVKQLKGKFHIITKGD